MAKTKRTISEMSIETGMIAQRLKRAAVGDVIKYQELSELVGRDVQADGYAAMASARRICQRDERMVFEVIKNEGLKRLDDSGIAATGVTNLKRIGRQARRGMQALACVKQFDAMPESAKVEHNMSMSLMGAMTQMTRKPKLDKLRMAVANAQQRLPLAKTLEMFTGHNGEKK